MKQTVINAVMEHRIIAIVRGVQGDKLIPLAQALYEGGIRLIEITYSANGSASDEETARHIDCLAKHFAGKVLVGAGTVLTEKQVILTKQAGGLFIISPNTDEIVIGESNRLGLVSMPGALTPTEIAAAYKAGADFVKVFPVSNFGAKYVNAVKAPLAHIPLLAVGGIDENNVAEYIRAGACGAGVGGNLVNHRWIKSGEFDKITEVARKLMTAAKEC